MSPAFLDTNLTTLAIETTTTSNPWPVFGPLQYFEVAYLLLVVIVGTFGNLVVILSVVYAKKVHKTGNIFIINLAVADLLITGIVIPTVIASVIIGDNALTTEGCKVVGVIVSSSCTCSIYNLMFIAANRCCSIANPMRYHEIFSKRYENLMVLGIWVWAVLLLMPTFFGWGDVRYEPSALACYWDEKASVSYTIFITMFAVFVPLVIIGFCYVRLFFAVLRSTESIRSFSATNTSIRNGRSLTREQRLFRTLFTTVVVFLICWMPFAISAVMPSESPAHAKKIFCWLALTNSSVNFVIYGALNSGFRKGYRNLLVFIFCCRDNRRRTSTRNGGVNYTSDSSNNIRRVRTN